MVVVVVAAAVVVVGFVVMVVVCRSRFEEWLSAQNPRPPSPGFVPLKRCLLAYMLAHLSGVRFNVSSLAHVL